MRILPPFFPPARLTALCPVFCLASLTSCQPSKKVWSEADNQAWLTSCNAKFSKQQPELATLKTFCDCLLDTVQYDYTYEELKTVVVKSTDKREYFNNCTL